MSSPTPAERPTDLDAIEARANAPKMHRAHRQDVAALVAEVRYLREQNDGLYAAIQMDAKARAGVSLSPTARAAESTLAQSVTGLHHERKNGVGAGHCVQCREKWPCAPWKLAMVVLDVTVEVTP